MEDNINIRDGRGGVSLAAGDYVADLDPATAERLGDFPGRVRTYLFSDPDALMRALRAVCGRLEGLGGDLSDGHASFLVPSYSEDGNGMHFEMRSVDAESPDSRPEIRIDTVPGSGGVYVRDPGGLLDGMAWGTALSGPDPHEMPWAPSLRALPVVDTGEFVDRVQSLLFTRDNLERLGVPPGRVNAFGAGGDTVSVRCIGSLNGFDYVFLSRRDLEGPIREAMEEALRKRAAAGMEPLPRVRLTADDMRAAADRAEHALGSHGRRIVPEGADPGPVVKGAVVEAAVMSMLHRASRMAEAVGLRAYTPAAAAAGAVNTVDGLVERLRRADPDRYRSPAGEWKGERKLVGKADGMSVWYLPDFPGGGDARAGGRGDLFLMREGRNDLVRLSRALAGDDVARSLGMDPGKALQVAGKAVSQAECAARKQRALDRFRSAVGLGRDRDKGVHI